MLKVSLASLKNASLRKFSSDAKPTKYSGPVQFLHWSMGGSMLACVGLVLAAQNTKDKTEKGNFMFYHKSFGLLSAILLGPRLAVKFASKNPGAVEGASTLEHLGATLSHYLLYVFIIALPVSGVVMGTTSGNGLPFFFTTFPSLKKDPAIAKQAFENHKLLGQAFEYFIPLHVGGALYHVVRGHSIFPRILPLAQKVATKAPKV